MTDLHVRGSAPVRRRDDWPGVCLRKLQAVRRLAERNEADFILVGGDFFDSYRPGYGLIFRVAEVVSGGPPWYIVAGNHDIVGRQRGALENTALGLLAWMPEMHIAPDRWYEGDVQFRAWHYEHGIDKQTAFCSGEEWEGPQVAVAHAMLVPDPVPYEHVRLEDVETDADLFLCGHSHEGWSPIDVRGTLFLHPGSMTRLSLTRENLRRKPRALVIDIDSEGIEVEEVLIPAASGRAVFDLATWKRDKRYGARIEDLLRALESATVQGGGLRERVEKTAAECGLDRAVLDVVLDRIDNAVRER